MYETPSDKSIVRVTVTRDCVENGAAPLIERDTSRLEGPISGHLPAELA